MEATIDQTEFFDFPVIAEKTAKRGVFAEYVAATREHGPLLQVPMIAAAMKLSRQRVHVLIDQGRIAAQTIGKHRYVPAAALELFLTEERKNGVRYSPPHVLDLLRTVGQR
jgi:hypothetical protein